MKSFRDKTDVFKALGVIVALAFAGAIPGLRWLGMLLLPGGLLAALLFPEGINSDHGWTFLVLAAIADWLIAWGCIRFVRWLKRRLAMRHGGA
jgi:hypothetical protein